MVAPLLGPLLGGVLGAVTNNVVALVIKLAGNGYDLWSNFDSDINFIKRELVWIAGAEEDQLTEELRDLALEIEDLLDRVLRHVVKRDEGPVHKALGFADGLQLEAEVTRLKEGLKAAHQRKSHHKVDGRQLSAVSMPTGNTYTTKVGPVGISESKREICEWVMKDVEGEPEQLSVISIVGFSGSGKSTLAKAVYDSPDTVSKFPHRAWVVASKYLSDTGTKGLLKELFQNLGQGDKISDSDDVEQLQVKISNYLKKTKRYLIVFDDINKQQWFHIENTFHENKRGRIIVTTTIQADANTCSSGDGYVYSMRPLDGKNSKLLLQTVLKKQLPGLEQSSDLIVNKCDGHPLALVSVAKYLRSKTVFTETDCKNFWCGLGDRMKKGAEFLELGQVLKNYSSLPAHPINLKICLLYMSVFPNGHPINSTRLLRRWLAQGYLQHQFRHNYSRMEKYQGTALLDAEEILEELVDRNIIWPIECSKNAKVKTCRAHSIMHELMLHMSMSTMLITSIENPNRSDYRHLFIQNGHGSNLNHRHDTSPSHGGKSVNGKEYRAHSLTICGSAGEAVGYFVKCQLLRVLDLEDCKDLEDKHLDDIHKLWYLKYLSVGDNISRLPKDIEKLHWLETLDMRKTKKVIILPVEVIKLPHLAHLLGRYKLGKRDWDESTPQKYVPEKSNLQTLAGFVTDNNPGFSKLMLYMKMLKKVKICCNSTTDEGLDDLLVAIENFVQADLDTGVCARSLSLDIGNFSVRILRSLAYSNLRSLKLHGELNRLVHFTTSLWNLRELCLSSTNGLTKKDLSDMRRLSDLESLRLDGVSLEGFVITSEDFPGLLRLCLVQCTSLPKIEEGALPNLLSLRLLNHGLDGLSGIEIKRHKLLQEIALDSEVKQETKTDWEDAAKNHPKKPRVLYLKRVDVNSTGSTVKYVATQRTVTGSSTVLGKRRIPSVESNSVDQPSSSDLKHIKREDDHSLKEEIVPDTSSASTEFCSAMDIDMPSSSRMVS